MDGEQIVPAVTNLLSGAWTETLTGVTKIMSNPTAALGLTLPMVGLVIGIAKKLFRRSR